MFVCVFRIIYKMSFLYIDKYMELFLLCKENSHINREIYQCSEIFGAIWAFLVRQVNCGIGLKCCFVVLFLFVFLSFSLVYIFADERSPSHNIKYKQAYC